MFTHFNRKYYETIISPHFTKKKHVVNDSKLCGNKCQKCIIFTHFNWKYYETIILPISEKLGNYCMGLRSWQKCVMLKKNRQNVRFSLGWLSWKNAEWQLTVSKWGWCKQCHLKLEWNHRFMTFMTYIDSSIMHPKVLSSSPNCPNHHFHQLTSCFLSFQSPIRKIRRFFVWFRSLLLCLRLCHGSGGRSQWHLKPCRGDLRPYGSLVQSSRWI